MQIRPQPGFQEMFLSTQADIAIGGGAAGAGKSWTLAIEPLRHSKVPGFSAAIFRRTSPELVGPGSIWSETMGIYPSFGAQPKLSPLEWRFPSGASVVLSHLQQENDVLAHHSKAYALLEFDELTSFTEAQFWYLWTRNRSTCGIRPYTRASCNPDPDSFAAKLIKWWIDQDTGYPIAKRAGVLRWFVRAGEELIWADAPELLRKKWHGKAEDFLPTSLTFIPGNLEENQILMEKDPSYRARLVNQPTVVRERLLKGNWKIRPASGMYFKKHKFEIVDAVPSAIVRIARAWDKAATEPTAKNKDPDRTAGVKMAKLADGRYIVLDVRVDALAPAGVDHMMRNTAELDGIEIPIVVFKDPGAAGKFDVEHMRSLLVGFSMHVLPATMDKITMAGPLSTQADGGKVLVLRGQWNSEYLERMESFPEGHDDEVDASSAAFRFLHLQDTGPSVLVI